jgi:hypothetical protein
MYGKKEGIVMKKVKKIDIHVHSVFEKWNFLEQNSNWTTPAELKVKYEELGIEKGVQLPLNSPEGRFQIISNQESYKLAKEYPNQYDWFCNPDPREGNNTPNYDLSQFLKFYKSMGAKGVGEVTVNLPFDDPYMENLFKHCEAEDMPLLFHMGIKNRSYGIVDEIGMPKLEGALKKFPKLQFIAHSTQFWSQISGDVDTTTYLRYPTGSVSPGGVIIRLLDTYPNLMLDVSAGSGGNAIMRDRDFGYWFLEQYQDRIYFGTDICAPKNEMRLSHYLDEAMEQGNISYIAYEKICRENAMKLLKREIKF